MSVQLDHTIVRVRDRREAADFYAALLGLPPATTNEPFLELRTDNGAILAFADTLGEPIPMHYAFLVGEDDFDTILARVRERGLTHWADPFGNRPGTINHDLGRGVYWHDPSGHMLEILTRTDELGG